MLKWLAKNNLDDENDFYVPFFCIFAIKHNANETGILVFTGPAAGHVI